MSDYIKKEDVIQEVIYELDAFDHVPQALIDRIKRDFDTLPTADVVENVRVSPITTATKNKPTEFVAVVRCKDCKWYMEYIPRKGESAMMCFCNCCIGGQGKKKPTDYCSCGERKEHE